MADAAQPPAAKRARVGDGAGTAAAAAASAHASAAPDVDAAGLADEDADAASDSSFSSPPGLLDALPLLSSVPGYAGCFSSLDALCTAARTNVMFASFTLHVKHGPHGRTSLHAAARGGDAAHVRTLRVAGCTAAGRRTRTAAAAGRTRRRRGAAP